MNHSVSDVYLCRLHKQPSSKATPNLLELTVTSSIYLRFVLMLSSHLYTYLKWSVKFSQIFPINNVQVYVISPCVLYLLPILCVFLFYLNNAR